MALRPTKRIPIPIDRAICQSRMRSTARLLLVLALAASLLPGCSRLWPFKRKRPQVEQMAMPQIGTITIVNPESSFVLIDSGYRMTPAVGDIVESRAPDGSTAQLRVTEIRKSPFVIADIVSGVPGKGDLVFQKKKEVKVPATPLPQNQ